MIPEVEPLEAMNRIDAGAFLLDVREADEWEMGHAPEAVWIPLGELASRVSEIPADSEILVICRSGAVRPPRVACHRELLRPRRHGRLRRGRRTSREKRQRPYEASPLRRRNGQPRQWGSDVHKRLLGL